MQDQLAGYDFLDIEFVKAIDGRTFSDDDLQARFDYKKSRKLYGRKLNAGEVGCALSHRMIYQRILDDGFDYALVFEDDITLKRDLNSIDWDEVDKVMRSSRPRALMLSGDFCFYRKRPLIRIYSAVGAYAYIINKAAARLILKRTTPCCVADEWLYYKRKGVRLYALYPYVVDANLNMELLSSDVKQDTWGIDRKQMALKEVVIGAITGAIKRLFKEYDHFEYKTRVVGNKIVGRRKTNREIWKEKRQKKHEARLSDTGSQ